MKENKHGKENKKKVACSVVINRLKPDDQLHNIVHSKLKFHFLVDVNRALISFHYEVLFLSFQDFK